MAVFGGGEREVLGGENPIVERSSHGARGYDCMPWRNSTYISKEASIEGAKVSGQELHDHRVIRRRLDESRDQELVSVTRDRNPVTRYDVMKKPHAKRIARRQYASTFLIPDDEGIFAAQTGKEIVAPF